MHVYGFYGAGPGSYPWGVPGGKFVVRLACSWAGAQTKIPAKKKINLPYLPLARQWHQWTPATISHVIFDMDGLLLDTERFYTAAQVKILARHGKAFDWSVKAKMMGKKAAESARAFVDGYGLAGVLTPEQFLEEREGMLQCLFPSCTVMPGVLRLINHLHANKIPMAVATGSHRRHFTLKTQNHQEMFALIHHVVTGDDPEVKTGKPSPDIFLAAMRRFEGNVQPSNCLVFEDAPSGVAAAKNAGMYAVIVPDPRLDVSYHKGADQVLSSLMDFNPTEWGLPPFTE